MERGRSYEAFLNVLDGGHERTRFLISASLHRCFFFSPPFVSHPIMNYPGEFVVMLCGVVVHLFFHFRRTIDYIWCTQRGPSPTW